MKKHDLTKILFVVILAMAIMTWFIPVGTFTSATYTDKGVVPVSLYDFFITIFYSINYFLLQIIFLFAVGGFYGVLSKNKQYGTLVINIAKKVKGHVNIFIAIVSLLLAIFTSINSNALIGILFIPFIINILSKLHVDKMKSFAATFGAILVGLLGATYSTYGFNLVNQALGITVNDGMAWKVGFFAVAYGLLMVFIFMKRDNKKEIPEVEDIYELEPARKNMKVWPIILILGIVAIIGVIGYLPWVKSFDVTIFNNFHEELTALKIGDKELYPYILGSMHAIGDWDLFVMAFVLLIAAFIVALISNLKLNGFIEEFANGAKKISKSVFIYIMINCAFVIVYWSPITPTIVNKLIPSDSSFNLFILIIVGLIASILHVDHGYTGYTICSYLASIFAGKEIIIMLVLNSIYGFTQLLVPTSIFLFVGLSYLNISYKDYLKYMWKFLLGLLFIIVLLQVILVYV